jgi:undecaprenyl diphosphate synthase
VGENNSKIKRGKMAQGKLKVLPVHVGIIMDGNGRWARKRKLPRIMGHREGLKAVRETIRVSKNLGIDYLTLYSFSAENWERPATEVKFLMKLMDEKLKAEKDQLNKEGVKVKFIGRKKQLPENLLQTMSDVEKLTAGNKRLTLTFAINYGGRQEIVDAVSEIIRNKCKKDEIDEELIGKFLYAPETSFPDLIIRTAGEKRLSNFLLWQSAYAEFYFTDVLWPDFKKGEFFKALDDYSKRQRKFGRITEE